MKPGYKTTEFWLSLAATVVGAMMASDLIRTGSTVAKVGGLVMSILSTLGYTYSRHQLKSGE